jgi:hypothetical protein
MTRSKTLQKALNYDLFGESIGLNYRGSDSFKTVPGLCFTVLSMFLIIYYSVGKVS